MNHLLGLLDQFPRTNPSEEIDVSKLFRQIRSRYKALCSTLGIRPSLRAAEDLLSKDSDEPKTSRRQVWKLEGDTKRVAEEDKGLNF